MKKPYNELTCLLGFHNYSDEATQDKHMCLVYFCKVCKKSAYRKLKYGGERWHGYDDVGNCIYIKFSDGEEIWLCKDKYWHCGPHWTLKNEKDV